MIFRELGEYINCIGPKKPDYKRLGDSGLRAYVTAFKLLITKKKCTLEEHDI